MNRVGPVVDFGVIVMGFVGVLVVVSVGMGMGLALFFQRSLVQQLLVASQ